MTNPAQDKPNTYTHQDQPSFSFRYPTPSQWLAEETAPGTIQFRPKDQATQTLTTMTVEIVETKINRAEIKELKINPQNIEFFELAMDEGESQSISFLMGEYLIRITLLNDQYQLKGNVFPEIIESFSALSGESN